MVSLIASGVATSNCVVGSSELQLAAHTHARTAIGHVPLRQLHRRQSFSVARANRRHSLHIHSSVPAVQPQRSTNPSNSKQKPSSLPTLPSSSLSAILQYSNRLLPSDGIPLYVGSSRLLNKTGLTIEEIQRDVATWAALGAELARQLGFTASEVTESQLRRVFQYYLPVFSWAWKQLQEHRESGNDGPLVIGISAPQGCGKTTVVESMHHLFTVCGINAASVSIDDFYLTYEDQAGLKEAHSGNHLLELRGNAGSHDLELGTKTLRSLLAAKEAGEAISVPRYNKSAYQGKGDRALESEWAKVQPPVEVVLFEGWMLGFTPLPEDQAAALDLQLLPVNAFLHRYSEWYQFIHKWMVIQVEDVQWVYNWRLQAEVAMRAKGKAGMTDDEVADFVSRYIPAYKAYLSGLYANGPPLTSDGDTLQFAVDANRNIVK